MAVIDELIIIENGESKIVDSADNKTIDVINGSYLNNVDYHFAKENEVANGICENAVNEPIRDMQIKGNSVQDKLPSGYQEVEYIESTGTQYIDTGVPLSSNIKIESTFAVTDTTASRNYVFGAYGGDYTRIQFSYSSQAFFGWSDTYETPALSVDTKKHTINLSEGIFTLDGTIVKSITNTPFSSDTTLTLFALNSAGGAISNFAKMRMYTTKIYEGNTMIRHLVPCHGESDGKTGMYDLINNKFYTNQGTGSFIAGNNIPNPQAPIEVESVGDKTKNLFDAYINNSQWLVKTEILDNNIIKQTGASSTSSDGYSQFKVHLNIGTYTMSVSTSGNATGTAQKNVYIWKGPNATVGTVKILSFTNKGETTFEITEENDYWLGVYGGVFLDEVQLFQIQIEQGTVATDYEPYGYKIPVNISGKNLFNKSKATLNARLYKSSTDLQYDNISKDFFTSEFIKVEPETKYYYSKIGTDYTTRLIMANSDKQFIKDIDTNTQPTITTTEDTEYLIFNGLKTEIDEFMLCKFSDENMDTSYEPYVEPITTNIYLNEPLRKIGDYTDYIDYKNKKVVRNIGQITLNGSEDWKIATKFFYLASDGISNIVYSNHFKGIMPTTSDNMNNYEIQITASGNWFIRYDEFNGNLSGFKEWLSANNITNQYILKTLIEEPIDIPEISTFDGTTIIKVETSVEPSEFMVNYWKQT